MGMEFDEGVETINCLLERFYADWDSTDEEKKKVHSSSISRREEHRQEMVPASRTLERRNIGTVVAGSDVDMQMFEYCFPMKNMRREADIGPATLFHLTGHHALATSVASYPELKQICRYFDAVARKLLQKHNVTEDELRTWQNGLDWVVIRAGIAGCKMGPAQPYTLVYPPICRHSVSDISFFLRAALDL